MAKISKQIFKKSFDASFMSAVGIEGLTTVLTYHVAETCACSHDLTDGMTITTLRGETIAVDLDGRQLMDKTDSAKF